MAKWKPSEAAKRYAESQGLKLDDPRVRHYDEGKGADPDERKAAAIRHYASAIGADIDDPRVVKYAEGLSSESGDFASAH